MNRYLTVALMLMNATRFYAEYLNYSRPFSCPSRAHQLFSSLHSAEYTARSILSKRWVQASLVIACAGALTYGIYAYKNSVIPVPTNKDSSTKERSDNSINTLPEERRENDNIDQQILSVNCVITPMDNDDSNGNSEDDGVKPTQKFLASIRVSKNSLGTLNNIASVFQEHVAIFLPKRRYVYTPHIPRKINDVAPIISSLSPVNNSSFALNVRNGNERQIYIYNICNRSLSQLPCSGVVARHPHNGKVIILTPQKSVCTYDPVTHLLSNIDHGEIRLDYARSAVDPQHGHTFDVGSNAKDIFTRDELGNSIGLCAGAFAVLPNGLIALQPNVQDTRYFVLCARYSQRHSSPGVRLSGQLLGNFILSLKNSNDFVVMTEKDENFQVFRYHGNTPEEFESFQYDPAIITGTGHPLACAMLHDDRILAAIIRHKEMTYLKFFDITIRGSMPFREIEIEYFEPIYYKYFFQPSLIALSNTDVAYTSCNGDNRIFICSAL